MSEGQPKGDEERIEAMHDDDVVVVIWARRMNEWIW